MQTQHLVEELYFCEAECRKCYEECLLISIGHNNEKLNRCMILNQECADTCRIAAISIEKDSENADKFLNLCAEICEAAAIECEKHDYNHCQACAKACFKCAEMCLIFQQTPKEVY
jgi:hypothetical protein